MGTPDYSFLSDSELEAALAGDLSQISDQNLDLLLKSSDELQEEPSLPTSLDTPPLTSGPVDMGNRVSLNPETDITVDAADAIMKNYYSGEEGVLKQTLQKSQEELRKDALNKGISLAVPMALGGVAGLGARGFAASRGLGSFLTGVADYLGFTGGEALGRTLTDERGLGSLEDYTDFSNFGLNNPAVTNAAFSMLPLAKGAVSKGLEMRKPSAINIAKEGAKRQGQIVTQLNLNTTPSGAAKATELAAREADFLATGVLDDVVRNSDDPYRALSNNVDNKLKEYRIKENKLINESDARIREPAKLDEFEQFTQNRIDNLRAQGDSAYYDPEAISEALKWKNNESLYTADSKTLQAKIGKIDNRLKELGTYDRSRFARDEKGNASARALDNEEKGLKYLRDYLVDTLDKRTEGAFSAGRIPQSALNLFKAPVSEAGTFFRKEFSPIKAVREIDRPLTGFADATANTLGGGVAGKEARRQAGVIGADKQAIENSYLTMLAREGKLPPKTALGIIGEMAGSPSAVIPAGKGLASILSFEQDPYANGLPRESSRFGMDAVVRLASNLEQSIGADPQAEVKLMMLKNVGIEFAKAEKAGDELKKQKLIADMAKMAPEHFEPGRGIDNRLFHQEDQSQYMEELKRLQRAGKIGASFLAKQQDIFYDKNDGRILDLEEPLSQKMLPKGGQLQSPAGIFPTPKKYLY